MSNKKSLFGAMIPAMVTPFTSQGELDLDRACALANRLAEGGATAVVICGTTGECPTLTHAEKLDLFRAVHGALGGKIPVIANVGNYCTKETIDAALEVESLGVEGLMCVVPYYSKPPQEGLYEHFSTIAHAVNTPIVLYNIPGRCVVNMEAETTLRLAHDCENIVAIKEASGKLDQIEAIISQAPKDFIVYSGDDAATYDIMKLGGAGVISTIANVAPSRMAEITNLCAQDKWDDALYAHKKLEPLMKGLFETSNPILVKEALSLAGFPVGGVRLPLINATQIQSEKLAQTMREVGVL